MDQIGDDVSPDRPVASRTRRLSNTRAQQNSINESACSQHAIATDDLVVILQKEPDSRTMSDRKILEDWRFLIPEAEAKIKKLRAKSVIKQRNIEKEETVENLEAKSFILARMIQRARYIIIYTGAGISTSASIPDYRGPNGIWTQIKRTGTFSMTKIYDVTLAEPTYTHMAIQELCRRGIVKHVVSQNCDGLHIRSGLPSKRLSEIHGNMYIEVCANCERQYYRQTDVTGKTSRFRHKTGRKCHTCREPNNDLTDTIVLYGEKSRTKFPIAWEEARDAANHADLIICLGSSLKTLRRYSCLWPRTLSPNSNNKEPETKLVIVNLQYTSKDKNATLKINGKCDVVMQLVMQQLNIPVPAYDLSKDPLQILAIPFSPKELAHLKSKLLFENKQSSPAAGSSTSKRSGIDSPSLFVSELNDDPECKRVRMRIKAINHETASTSSDLSREQGDQTSKESGSEKQSEREDTPNDQTNYPLPGWFAKGMGMTRGVTNKRKRHGNKKRKLSNNQVVKIESTALSSGEDDEERRDKVEDEKSRVRSEMESVEEVG